MSPRGWASAIATRLPRGQRRRTRRREPRVVAATDYNGLRQHAGRQSPEQLRHAVARAFPDHTAGSRPPLLVRVRRRCVNPGVVILARAFPTNTAGSRPPLLGFGVDACWENCDFCDVQLTCATSFSLCLPQRSACTCSLTAFWGERINWHLRPETTRQVESGSSGGAFFTPIGHRHQGLMR